MANDIMDETAKALSRRRFIKTVVAGVASANYLFRSSAVQGQSPIAGAGERSAIGTSGTVRC